MPDSTEVKDLREAVSDAAGVSNGLWLSYLFVMFYLFVAAGGVTHLDLFLENQVRLPFLSVDLPMKGFFVLGPLIFLVVHAYVLLHLVLLAERARLLAESPGTDDRLLPVNVFVQLLAGRSASQSRPVHWLIVSVAWISLVAGPVALLVFFELRFLPYHGEGITWWHRAAVALDLALLWTLWPKITWVSPGDESQLLRRAGVAIIAVVSLISAFLVLGIATFPGEWWEQVATLVPFHEELVGGDVDDRTLRPTSWFPNRLVVPGLDLVDHTRLDTAGKLAASPVLRSLRDRNLERAVLTDSDLPRIDFTSANLKGASFIRARVQGAWFDRADLSGARLDAASLQGASFYRSRLLGASLEDAQLQGGRLAGAQMKGAWLKGAKLDAASLASADLRWASLDEASLSGANLYEARLEGASLQKAELQGASLKRTFVWRTDFRAVRVSGVARPRIEELRLGPEEPPCNGPPGDACDKNDNQDRIRKLVARYVPESEARTRMLSRLWLDLKSRAPQDWERESEKRFAVLQAMEGGKDDARSIELWREIACAGSGAPFVIAMLIDTINDANALTLPRGKKAREVLVNDLLANDKYQCAARPEITEATRMQLLDMRQARAREGAGTAFSAQAGQ